MMNPAAKSLGYAGLVPFFTSMALYVTHHLSLQEANIVFTQYSAVLLSFFGGIMWYDALLRQLSVTRLCIAMLPTIVGASCLVLPLTHIEALLPLMLSYIAVMVYDWIALDIPHKTVYMRLRYQLTGIVTLLHAIMIGVSLSA